VADNPVLFRDPDGKRIKIVWRDENGHRRVGIYNADKGIAVNKKGEEVHGKFVDDVVKSLNYVKDGKDADGNKADVQGIIKKVADAKMTVTIKHTNSLKSNEFNGLTHTIKYNPAAALEVLDTRNNQMHFTGTFQTPALGLFHEIGHAWNFFVDQAGYWDRNFTKDHPYDNKDDRYVIENYETPAAKVLGEPTRLNHTGWMYESTGPTSTTKKIP
jgi:hypothetical protein